MVCNCAFFDLEDISKFLCLPRSRLTIFIFSVAGLIPHGLHDTENCLGFVDTKWHIEDYP
ncbi:MAG: hypothetical protein F6K17_06750 [Okeania sp. SIO3C4]|nr:hypothetical protein [Okeania sp. SIO3C4]